MSKPLNRQLPASCLYLWFLFAAGAIDTQGETPQLSDERLELTLFAEAPDIVTPIGMAIDSRDRIFVIESHTHDPPSDYEGPKTDRIKCFVDEDQDGRVDRVSVFADGIRQAMNLAFSPDGDLFVVCAREVIRLSDENDDGTCDSKAQVLRLITTQRYAHNSLLGITFDRDGWMYVSRGNTGSSAYRFAGKGESTVSGYGDGGNVIRCRPDGTEISEFATGFWNPFDLKFDRSGRLLLVDNDPDARGPNRLLQVVPGGDYGYKSLFGGGGTHPFQGWDGRLPGTLPFIAGTGEAPSGLIDCRRTAFPRDYHNSILATIWNENTIERFELDPISARLRVKSVFLKGDQNFRPVAVDCDSRGNLFITDWVLVDYPNHGRGRIWRVSAKNETPRTKPQPYFAPYHPNQLLERIQSLCGPATASGDRARRPLPDPGDFADSADPLLRHAAIQRLAGDDLRRMRSDLRNRETPLRMASLLATRLAEPNNVDQIRSWLSDADPRIRLAALQWAGESGNSSLAKDLPIAIGVSPVTAELFEMYVAAAEVLEPEFVAAYGTQSASKANQIKRKTDPKRLIEVATNESLSPTVRRMAIDRYDESTRRRQTPALKRLLRSQEDLLAIAAVEALGALTDDRSHRSDLLSIAMDRSRSDQVRLSALSQIASGVPTDPQAVMALKKDPSDRVRAQAARVLRTWGLSPEDAISDPNRPHSQQQWQDTLSKGGDPLLGRHVFFSPRVGCAKCHRLDGRGGTLGPGLAGLAASKSRGQIIRAILDPSADFAPQYQAWMVLTTDGKIHRGLQLDHKARGAIMLTLENGTDRHFKSDEIETYRALPNSLMPAGLADTMSVDEFRDLIAFLLSLDHSK